MSNRNGDMPVYYVLTENYGPDIIVSGRASLSDVLRVVGVVLEGRSDTDGALYKLEVTKLRDA